MDEQGDSSTLPNTTQTLVSDSNHNPPSTARRSTLPEEPDHGGRIPDPAFNQADILKALEVAERDSTAIAESFTSLFDSLRVALSEVTSSSVDHMQVFSDAAGRLQESVLDAATKGNRYINSCLRLNEEMKGVDNLAVQLFSQKGEQLLTISECFKSLLSNKQWRKVLRRNVDALDMAVDKLIRLP